jgi:hypothetical protein
MIRQYRSTLIETFPKIVELETVMNLADLMDYVFPLESFSKDLDLERKEVTLKLKGKIHVGKSGAVIGFLTPNI